MRFQPLKPRAPRGLSSRSLPLPGPWGSPVRHFPEGNPQEKSFLLCTPPSLTEKSPEGVQVPGKPQGCLGVSSWVVGLSTILVSRDACFLASVASQPPGAPGPLPAGTQLHTPALQRRVSRSHNPNHVCEHNPITGARAAQREGPHCMPQGGRKDTSSAEIGGQ